MASHDVVPLSKVGESIAKVIMNNSYIYENYCDVRGDDTQTIAPTTCTSTPPPPARAYKAPQRTPPTPPPPPHRTPKQKTVSTQTSPPPPPATRPPLLATAPDDYMQLPPGLCSQPQPLLPTPSPTALHDTHPHTADHSQHTQLDCTLPPFMPSLPNYDTTAQYNHKYDTTAQYNHNYTNNYKLPHDGTQLSQHNYNDTHHHTITQYDHNYTRQHTTRPPCTYYNSTSNYAAPHDSTQTTQHDHNGTHHKTTSQHNHSHTNQHSTLPTSTQHSTHPPTQHAEIAIKDMVEKGLAEIRHELYVAFQTCSADMKNDLKEYTSNPTAKMKVLEDKVAELEASWKKDLKEHTERIEIKQKGMEKEYEEKIENAGNDETTLVLRSSDEHNSIAEICSSSSEGQCNDKKLAVKSLVQRIWKRLPRNVTSEEYESYYKLFDGRDHALHDGEKFAAAEEGYQAMRHFTIEGQLELQAILYVPYCTQVQSGQVRLFVQDTLCMDDCEELLPEWLSCIRGVVHIVKMSTDLFRVLQCVRRILVVKCIEMYEGIAAQNCTDPYVLLGIAEQQVSEELSKQIFAESDVEVWADV